MQGGVLARSDDSILASIYEAAWELDRWEDALNVMADNLGGLDVQVLINDHSMGPYIVGRPRRLSMEAQNDYLRRWIVEDPRARVADSFVVGKIFSCHEYFDEQYVRTSRFFQEFLIPDGGRFIAGGRVLETSTATVYTGLHRSTAQGPLPQPQVEKLRVYSNEIARSVRFYLECEALRVQNAALSSILDFLPMIACVTDSSCRLIASSLRAEKMFAENDGISIRSGFIMLSRSDDETMLRRSVQLATQSKGKRASSFVIARRSDGSRVNLEVMPLGASLPRCAEWQRDLAIVLIEDSQPIALPTGRRLQEIFGLTPAEARLAVDLAAGKRPNAIALERGVRMPTVRSQIRAVLQKTGSNRQSDLIKILARIPVRL